MAISSILQLLTFAFTSSLVVVDQRPWIAPGKHAVRGPCPALNTLANHNFIPHSGRHITVDHLIAGLKAGMNVGEDVAIMAGNNAFQNNPTQPATSFDLDMLNRHNTIEHDNSLTRADFYTGDNHSFNRTIYEETVSHFTSPVINMTHAVAALESRIETSRRTNPTYVFDLDGTTSTTASYLSVFGHGVAAEADREWVKYFFEHERLPYELGWSPGPEEFGMTKLMDLMDQLASALPYTHPLPAFSSDIHSHDLQNVLMQKV